MKHNLEKVSIVIPVYKVEQYIDQCLESICIQTYKNLEIIIVFDESPDGSLIKCKNWIAKDNRIRLIINSQRKGLGTARNIGLKAATGKYIVYVDSDDWIENNYIEILYKSIERTQANYVSSIGFYEVNAENDINICKALPAGEYSSESEKMLVLLKEIPAVWKRIYNREWLIESELYQPELFHYEDWGFDIALVLRAKKIVLIPEMGLYYRNEREGCLLAHGVPDPLRRRRVGARRTAFAGNGGLRKRTRAGYRKISHHLQEFGRSDRGGQKGERGRRLYRDYHLVPYVFSRQDVDQGAENAPKTHVSFRHAV